MAALWWTSPLNSFFLLIGPWGVSYHKASTSVWWLTVQFIFSHASVLWRGVYEYVYVCVVCVWVCMCVCCIPCGMGVAEGHRKTGRGRETETETERCWLNSNTSPAPGVFQVCVCMWLKAGLTVYLHKSSYSTSHRLHTDTDYLL